MTVPPHVIQPCAGCGTGCLVAPGAPPPESCNACDPAARALIADAAEAIEVFTADELERAAADERARVAAGLRQPGSSIDLSELLDAPAEQRYVLRLSPGRQAEVIVVAATGPTLPQLQGWVGGYLEPIPIVVPTSAPMLLLVDEEGVARSHLFNYPAARASDRRIVGPAVIVVSQPPEMLGLTREQVGELMRWCA